MLKPDREFMEFDRLQRVTPPELKSRFDRFRTAGATPHRPMLGEKSGFPAVHFSSAKGSLDRQQAFIEMKMN